MATSRVLVVSDTHLSPRTPDAVANWSAIVDHVAARRPDLVLHLGDLALDGPHGEGDLQYARAQLDRLPVPWLAVPGNHDIGDNPSPVTPPGAVVDPGGLRRWTDLIGSDRWSAECGDWRLIAVNAQLFGSGLPAEDDQWTWLEAELRQPSAEQPVAFHHPQTPGGRRRRRVGCRPALPVCADRGSAPAGPASRPGPAGPGAERARPSIPGAPPRWHSTRLGSDHVGRPARRIANQVWRQAVRRGGPRARRSRPAVSSWSSPRASAS